MNDLSITELVAAIDMKGNDETIVDLPETAPFDPEQREWLNGLLTGITALAAAAKASNEPDAPGTPISIFYGSQSGNCEVLAKDLKKYAATQGFEASIDDLDSTSLESMATLNHVLIICATFGEGEPTDNAKNFYASIMSSDAPALPPSLNFSVCGLGDSSYTHFNKCSKDIYTRMAELGATPCHDLIACDTAFEDDYADWKTAVFNTEVFVSAAGTSSEAPDSDDDLPLYTKNHPFLANLISCENLSGTGSNKRVNHIEISLAGAGEDMHYDVGDVLGVWPLNSPELVDEILDATTFTGKETVELKSGPGCLKMILLSKMDLNVANAKTLETWGIEEIPEDYQVLDILEKIKPELTAQTFIDGLRPLQPRLYSIASSSKAHPGEVHLTVGEVHYELFDKKRVGVASTWLGNRLPDGANLGVYLQSSAHFHIPDDDNAPLIMIGPGTGIAPFRAFLEEREVREAQGDNWLFFGDQHESEDYLYQEQIEAWKESGLLNKLSLAWSRDSAGKVYVQHLIKESGEEFYQWLEQGSYIYICGDATRMAVDVDAAIREVIAEHGKLDEAGVESYMETLVSEHRYQRDVY